MKRALLIILLFICNVNLLCSQELKAITYNIRYDNPGDGENRWSLRKEFLTGQIKFYEPDFFGIQEGLNHQVAYLDSTLTQYKYVGVGRDDGQRKGEYSAIFYDTHKLKVIKSSTFWLSNTPETISVGWDASMERICTYSLFEIKSTGQKIWVFNTHFDHIGVLAQENSAKLIIDKIKSLNQDDYPVVMMGDLNIEPSSKTYQFLASNLYDSKDRSAEVPFGPNGTYNGFKFDKPVTKRIDYIFTGKKGLRVNKYAVLSDSKNCRYPSDHLPVYIEMIMTK